MTPSPGADEAALIAALRDGDPEAFRTVFDEHADRLYRLATGILHDPDDAEDAVQETFIALSAQLDRFEGRARLGTWLYRVARNEALQRLRRPDRQPARRPADLDALLDHVSDDRGTDPAAAASTAEDLERIDAALRTLPETLRAAFLLRDIEGLSTREAADALEITESALKVRLHRARQAVRSALAPAVLPPTTDAAGLSCETALEWLDGYLEDSLPADDRRQLEAHVERCEHCRITVDTARRTIELSGVRRHWIIPAPRGSAMFEHLAAVFASRRSAGDA